MDWSAAVYVLYAISLNKFLQFLSCHKRLHHFDFEFDSRCPFFQQTVPLSDAVGMMNRLRHKREIVNILVNVACILFFLEISNAAIVIFNTALGEGVQQTYESIAMFPITNGMLWL